MILLTIPGLRLVSLNARSSTGLHWHAKARRVKVERAAVHWACLAVASKVAAAVRHLAQGGHLAVTMIRVSPSKLDTDNVVGACKAIRDQVAAELGIDDGPREKRIVWLYDQRKPPAGTKGPARYAVEIRIEARAAGQGRSA